MKINLEAIIKIESGGNPNAFNERSGARGLCQITKVCWEEFNHFKGRVPFNPKIEELFDPWMNRKVADWYLNTRIPEMLVAFNIPVTIDNILIAYNWGIGNLAKLYRHERGKTLPKETADYLKKYKQLTEGDHAI